RPGTRVPDQQVGPDGAISIPYAGRVPAAARSPAEVERTIEARLGPKALEPHALVVIRRSISNSVAVAGDAVKGGRVPLSPGGDRLLEVVAAAGGANAPPHETFVQLSRAGLTATVSLATLVDHPDQNIFAEPGDAKSYPLAQEFRVRDKDIIFVANAELAGVYKGFNALSKLTGPIITGLLVCQNGGC